MVSELTPGQLNILSNLSMEANKKEAWRQLVEIHMDLKKVVQQMQELGQHMKKMCLNIQSPTTNHISTPQQSIREDTKKAELNATATVKEEHQESLQRKEEQSLKLEPFFGISEFLPSRNNKNGSFTLLINMGNEKEKMVEAENNGGGKKVQMIGKEGLISWFFVAECGGSDERSPASREKRKQNLKGAGLRKHNNLSKVYVAMLFNWNVGFRWIVFDPGIVFMLGNVGGLKRSIYIHVGLCLLLHLQRCPKTLSIFQSSSLVDKSRQKPKKKIMVLNDVLNAKNDDAEMTLAEFEIFNKCLALFRANEQNLMDVVLKKNAKETAWYMRLELGNVNIKRSDDGGIYVRLQESVRVCDIFLIQPACPPANENLMELLVLIEACKRTSTKNITAAVPYFGHARADRKTQGCESIAATLIANIISGAGANRVLVGDLHSGKSMGYFDISIDHNNCQPVILDYLASKSVSSNDLVVVSHAGNSLSAAEKEWKLHVSKVSAIILVKDVSHGFLAQSNVPLIGAIVNSKEWPLPSHYRVFVQSKSSKVEPLEIEGAISLVANMKIVWQPP